MQICSPPAARTHQSQTQNVQNDLCTRHSSAVLRLRATVLDRADCRMEHLEMFSALAVHTPPLPDPSKYLPVSEAFHTVARMPCTQRDQTSQRGEVQKRIRDIRKWPEAPAPDHQEHDAEALPAGPHQSKPDRHKMAQPSR